MNKMLGVKVYDPSFCSESSLDLLQEIGINTVFLGRGALNSEIAEELSRRGLFWNIVEPVFLVSDEDNCNLALKEDGSEASDDWVRFACPTDDAHLKTVRDRIRSDIKKYDPPGVSLDFIRFFQFWEMTPPSAASRTLPRTCYCKRCRDRSSVFNSEREWRQNVITNTAAGLCGLAREMNGSLRIGIHAVPWTRALFDGARYDVMGQDFAALAGICDYLTPMAYHHMMHMPVTYINDLVSDMADEGCSHIVPSVQAKEAYRTDPMDAEEYGKALDIALGSASEGVLVYKWEDLAADKKRLGITKAAFKGL